MRTRNADNPKSPPLAKRTPPARKSTTKTPPTPPIVSQQSLSEPTVTPTRASSTRGKAVATNDASTTIPEVPVEAVKGEDEAAKVTQGTNSPKKRTVKRVVKRTVIRKKSKSGLGDAKTSPASVGIEQDDSEVLAEQEISEDVRHAVPVKQEELSRDDVNDVGMYVKDDKVAVKAEDTTKDAEDDTDVAKSVEHHESELGEKENMETEKNLNIQEPVLEKEEVVDKEHKETDDEEPGTEVVKEGPDVEELVGNREITLDKEINVEIKQVSTEVNEDKLENNEQVGMVKGINVEFNGEEDPQERLCLSVEEKDKDISDNELEDVKMQKHDELRFREHEEFTEAAEERKRRKEFEVFVGGLSRDALEEDVKKVFKHAGEVVEVRMHKEPLTNKNKGYAFVRFASKEQVARALAEMKNPVIRGKRCGTAPSEDNDTLFLGNICNTWTKEDIKQKLKDYDVEGVERITLVADPQHEELSRGFAFLEFTGHPDAMLAFKRLQKPDAVFGHPDRTAKVAFAEPLREPDPEVLAQVKSVFVDGLPLYWDEDTVRDHLKIYGTIERVMLARNMSTAKRKDFGFIDFTTHEDALACIDGINKRELGDEKTIVRARLSNPLPKTQAVKGGIAGGFRIGQDSGATYSGAGRGFGRGALPSDQMDFQRGRGFYQHGPGQTRGMGFTKDYPPVGPHPPFRGRHSFGGRWDDFRGPHQIRYDVDRPRNGANMPMRGPPYLPEERFSRPYGGRPYEDPYTYEDTSRGMKRPYFAELDSDYTEPSRGRPRMDYSDLAISAPGARYRGGGGGGPSRDYYNYDYSSYYGSDRPYGGDRSYGGGAFGSDRSYGGEPYGGDRHYGGGPYGGDRSYGGRYHY